MCFFVFPNTDPSLSGYHVWVDNAVRISPSQMEHKRGHALGLICFEWLHRASEQRQMTYPIAIYPDEARLKLFQWKISLQVVTITKTKYSRLAYFKGDLA